MSLIFFLFLGCAILSGIGIFYKKEIPVPFASVLVLFFCSIIAVGNFIRIWSEKTVFEVAFFPFFEKQGQTYFWELFLDFPAALSLLILTLGLFFFFAISLYRRPAVRFDILETIVFTMCFGAFVCFGAKNVFQLLTGWEICFVCGGLLGTLFSPLNDKAMTFKRFWIYHKISDVPFYVLLCAVCLRPDDGLATPFEAVQKEFFLLSLWGAIIFKASCLEVLSDAKVPAGVVLFIALFVFGVCFSYALCRFSPAGTLFSSPLYAFTASSLFFSVSGAFLSFKPDTRRFGAANGLKRRLRLFFVRRVRFVLSLFGMKKFLRRATFLFWMKTERLNESFRQNALVFIVGTVCMFVLIICFSLLKG